MFQIAVLFAKAQSDEQGFLTDDFTIQQRDGTAAISISLTIKALAIVDLSRTGKKPGEKTVKPDLLRGGSGCGAALRPASGREHFGGYLPARLLQTAAQPVPEIV